jgi:hypothetical protein
MAEASPSNATPFIIANPILVLISNAAKDVSIQNGQQPEISVLKSAINVYVFFTPLP